MTKHDEMKILRIELPEDILKAKWCGDFERAQRLIDIRLNDGLTPENQRQRLILEKEILRRLREMHYDGVVTVEHYGAPNQKEYMKKSMQWLSTRL